MTPRSTRIYADHAATGWPKPPGVVDAVADYMNHVGAAAGRGQYGSAAIAQQVVASTRRSLAQMLGGVPEHCISFHASGTAAIHAALLGMLRAGSHVVTTAAEHNSVLRPLDHLCRRGTITMTVVDVDRVGRVDADAVLDAIRDDTRWIAMTTASNVTGAIQPLERIVQEAQPRGVRVFCDAAQSFGWKSLDVTKVPVDLVAAPGHKASGGPLGTAMLYAGEHLHDEIMPVIFGGTGSNSESLSMPTDMPTKLEPGNLNVPAIAGWDVALKACLDAGDRSDRGRELAGRLWSECYDAGFDTTPTPGDLPIVPLWCDRATAEELAIVLDQEFHVEARAGLHCAAEVHRCLASPEEGELRLSLGPETSDETLRQLIEAIHALAAGCGLRRRGSVERPAMPTRDAPLSMGAKK